MRDQISGGSTNDRVLQHDVSCYYASIDRDLLGSRHAFFRQIDGDRLMPEAVGKVSSVLDVGAGTGDWAL